MVFDVLLSSIVQ